MTNPTTIRAETCETCQDTCIIEQETAQGEAYGTSCPDCTTPMETCALCHRPLHDDKSPAYQLGDNMKWRGGTKAVHRECSEHHWHFWSSNSERCTCHTENCPLTGGTDTIPAPTGATSAAEVNMRSLHEAFISHLEREGYQSTNDPVNDFPRKYETFLAGATFGYSQQPNTAALLAISAEIKARAEYYRSSDWSESAEICYQWAERIDAAVDPSSTLDGSPNKKATP